jgi:hypothetical protein
LFNARPQKNNPERKMVDRRNGGILRLRRKSFHFSPAPGKTLCRFAPSLDINDQNRRSVLTFRTTIHLKGQGSILPGAC